ncbi:hypothetical protein MCC_04665 [Rickettsia rhipicephali str. 3-7-female6-CWPP]|uniref:Acetyltransferase family protein n=1 Tax=Rickettsia rhipicephali (strain 3-7-female6-CWPP) TaxID=1105113 RepID=A0AAI8F7H4_RICR3|nr:hypothetical protein MCC_04665 [Rickettsia rhipicephali str. 3-7-female6-CWPP]
MRLERIIKSIGIWGHFFIIARFQNKGVGRQVAKQIW